MKVAGLREFRIPFPLIGLPMDGVYGTYMAIPLEAMCKLRMNFKVALRGNRVEVKFCGMKEPLRTAVERFLTLFLEAGALNARLMGEISIECSSSVPIVSQYVGVTNAIVESILHMNELRKYLASIAMIDSEVLDADPGYTLALRCALSTRTPCVTRGPNEMVVLRRGISITISEIVEATHSRTLQSQGLLLSKVTNIDRRVLSLYLKMISTAMPMIIDLVETGKEESARYLKIVLYTELALSGLSLDRWIEYPKVISDIGSFRIYGVKLVRGSW